MPLHLCSIEQLFIKLWLRIRLQCHFIDVRHDKIMILFSQREHLRQISIGVHLTYQDLCIILAAEPHAYRGNIL